MAGAFARRRQRARVACLLFAALTSCLGPPPPLVAPYTTPASGPAHATNRPTALARAMDPCFHVLGIASLADAELPPGYRELRLTSGPGMIFGEDYPVVRLVAGPDGVRGEVLRCWNYIDSSTHAIRRGAMRARPSHPVDWARLLAHLDSLGVSTFQALRYKTAIMDAGDLIVEVRDGAEYRGYEVNAPGWREDSLGRRSARIKAVVDSMDRLTRGY